MYLYLFVAEYKYICTQPAGWYMYMTVSLVIREPWSLILSKYLYLVPKISGISDNIVMIVITSYLHPSLIGYSGLTPL